MYNSPYNYNPLQSRMDSLMQQKQMIEQQLQSLQSMSAVPPININNNMTPSSVGSSFDFNGKWVDNEEQARQIVNMNKPLILFDNNNPIFYMKNMDGTFKKFHFEEIVEQPAAANNPAIENRMNQLEGKLDTLINALSGTNQQTNTNAPVTDENNSDKPKSSPRGGKSNG